MPPSDPTLETRALELLDEALEQPSADRKAWLAARTGDPALRDRVLALLDAADRGGSLHTGGARAEEPEVDPPDRIGAYRIGERLGQGGMGSVFRAERDTGDFKHVVAVKIIRPGVLSEALTDRFRRERQTLADLAHPNIARLFDGGETAEGQPYIIMELVQGRPITDWVKDKNLDLRSRISLFVAACEAVRFAHQNLIIHRDLTPSNVLVTDDGAVKLIDFGIAKPPEEATAAVPPPNSVAGLSLTPGFAAPERMTGAATSTLVDVYSLGRLLREMVSDLPADPDLDAIADRASAEAPEARYASVDALLDDVNAWLSGHPVTARGGGRSYAISKFVGRHRAAVAASAAGLALLVGALVVTLIAYGAADRARAAEAKRFEEVRALAGYMLFDLNSRLQRIPGNTVARVDLAAKAQRYLSTLAETRNAKPEVRLDTARGFIRLAQIQGVPPEPNFGEREDAKKSLNSAEEILTGLASDGMSASVLVPEEARIAAARSMLVGHGDADPPAAKKLLAAAWKKMNAIPAEARTDAWYLARRDLRRGDAEMAGLEDNHPAILAAANALEGDIASWPAKLRSADVAQEDRAIANYWRAASNAWAGKPAQSIPFSLKAREQLAGLEAKHPNDPSLLYWMAYVESDLFAAASNAPDSKALATDAIGRARAFVARLLKVEEEDNAINTLADSLDEAYAQELANQGKFAEAIALQRTVVAKLVKTQTPQNRYRKIGAIAWAEAILGVIAKKAGDRRLACDSWTSAEAKLAEQEAKKQILGFHASFLPGLRKNLKLCREGAPVTSFAALR